MFCLSPGRVNPKTKIYICCFFSKYAVLISKNKDWLAQSHVYVFRKSDMLFQWASIIEIQLNVLV